jgi:hypothetical protein
MVACGFQCYRNSHSRSLPLGFSCRGYNRRFNFWLCRLMLSFRALILGGGGKLWSLTTKSIGSLIVDQDTQILLIGVVNKSLDVIVQSILENMTRMYNTIWMLQPGEGATMQDVLIKEEMAKPWVAIRAYWRRRHAVGFWAWGSIGRLFLTLGISTSVMLLGAGLNTIAWPKLRWYPTRNTMLVNLTEIPTEKFTIRTPLQYLQRIDWAEDLRNGIALVGGVPKLDENNTPVLTGGAANEISGIISASTVFLALARLPGAYSKLPPEWSSLWDKALSYMGIEPRPDRSAYITGIQTRVNGATTQSISVQAQQVIELFKYHQSHDKSLGKRAEGFHGILQLTTPSLRTRCGSLTTDDVLENHVDVVRSDNSASFTVHVGANNGSSFAGASCILTLSQGFAPVEVWIVAQGAPEMGISNITAPENVQPLPIDTAPENAVLTSMLSAHFEEIMPTLHGMAPHFGLVPHLVMAARKLQVQHPDFDSDAAAMSPVIATLAQQQLSTASWTLRTHEGHLIASAPVHWQLYGSGPRIEWQWAIAPVLIIILLVTLNHIGLLLVCRFRPAPWLDLGGMLRVSNQTEGTLPSVERIRSVGPLRDREDVTQDANDMIRYNIRISDDQWPKLVEHPIRPDWDTRRRRLRHRRGQSTTPSPTRISLQTRPVNVSNVGATGIGSSSSVSPAPTLTVVPTPNATRTPTAAPSPPST